MAINFPNSPTVGQTFSDGGRTFVWSGSVWLLQQRQIPFATQAEVNAGTRRDVAVSPATAKAPLDSVIQPIGLPVGQPFDLAQHPFGGTPTNVLSQRTQGVAYQNPFTRSMAVIISAVSNIIYRMGTTNPPTEIIARRNRQSSTETSSQIALVPPGWWYIAEVTQNAPQVWIEYR